MKINLTDKVAVVTGAARGIGKACANLLSANDAKVVVADLSEAGKQTADELAKQGPCVFVSTDVTSETSVDNLISAAIHEFGRIDILVNNAGVNLDSGERTDITGFSTKAWQKILDVDLNGVFYCGRAAAKAMTQQKSGRIINVGSVLGSVPARNQIAYVAAKAAVHNATKAMALELAPFGINVNAVAPGSILTELTKELFYSDDPQKAAMATQMLSHVPLGRPGEPEDIANAILFLCGEESKYITGHVLTVDGGWTCGYLRDF